MKSAPALTFACLMLCCSFAAKAQFLFPESFVMVPLDTNRRHAGVIAGSFSSQTQKYVVNQIGTRAELASRIKGKHVVTVAENFQMVRNGSENILSGGYVFGRFRHRIDRNIYPEYMAQYQWMEARGLEQKIALTSNVRYRIVRTEKLSLAVAAGALVEYEKWDYDGVRDEKLPANTNPVEIYSPRLNTYISYDHDIGERVSLDIALYYQMRVTGNPSKNRLGTHARVNFIINKHFAYAMTLRLMHDNQPVVPIDNLWYNFSNELVVRF